MPRKSVLRFSLISIKIILTIMKSKIHSTNSEIKTVLSYLLSNEFFLSLIAPFYFCARILKKCRNDYVFQFGVKLI